MELSPDLDLGPPPFFFSPQSLCAGTTVSLTLFFGMRNLCPEYQRPRFVPAHLLFEDDAFLLTHPTLWHYLRVFASFFLLDLRILDFAVDLSVLSPFHLGDGSAILLCPRTLTSLLSGSRPK